jgi:hypothetical protein
MAAPAGNKFWQNRTRHGREKLFASAELMWAAAEEYFEWCDNNPWVKKELIKSGDMIGQLVDVPTQRPYTMGGLCIYLGCNEAYFRNFKAQLPAEDKDFSSVIGEIEQVIYTQKFEGAAVGAFNANIIARDLGLKEKSEVDHTTGGERIHIFQLPDNGRNSKDNQAATGLSDESTEQSG